MLGKVFYAAWVAFFVASVSTVNAAQKKSKKTKKMTIFERWSPEGPRQSPIFNLPVGGDESTNYPMKMAMFNNDLYESEAALLEENTDETIGYKQGHCVETVATGGFVGECFYTYVFDDGSSVAANGPFNLDAADGVLPTVLAVTGATGSLKKYTGEIHVSAGPAGDLNSLQFDFRLYK